ncbi:MAG TPA: hypothetical protein PKZ76_18790 [Xanthomonadaceae bacterium]|nr:hypothetical protein [Xanthomonadaceae bacterium]
MNDTTDCAIVGEADIQPYLDLWHTVLALMIEDARLYLSGRPDPKGVREAAYRDLCECGPMTRHLARVCLLEAEEVSRLFRMGSIEAAAPPPRPAAPRFPCP